MHRAQHRGAVPAAARRAAVGIGLALAALAGAHASGCDVDDARLEAEGWAIGEIAIDNGNIFDPDRPDEDRALFRLANRLHVRTRPGTIRALLLFRTGDRYRRDILDESERILRRQGYLYDAQIRPVRCEAGRVDVEVATRDVWTLKPTLTWSRKGGENTSRIGIEEDNLLGRGKSLVARRESDVDRDQSFLRYEDPNLAGRRGLLRLQVGDNSDGHRNSLAMVRPFYALDSRWSGGFDVVEEDRIDSLYAAGEVRDRFRHRIDAVEVATGWSDGLVRDRVRRWSVGFTYDRHRFEETPRGDPASPLPEERELAYPWVEFVAIRPVWVETRDLDQIARTEDLDLGRRLRVRLGRSDPAFGADRARTIVEVDAGAAFRFPRDQRIQISGAVSGRLGGPDRSEDVRAAVAGRYFVRDFGRHRLVVSARFEASRRLDADEQIVLGGDSGLRGYPLRYLEGDRAFLVTVEQRLYTSVHLFRLVHVGGAAFVDVGRAWFAGGDDGPREGVHRDVGIGLRLASSRSASASMVHIDLAFPLDGDPSIDQVQLLVSSGTSF